MSKGCARGAALGRHAGIRLVSPGRRAVSFGCACPQKRRYSEGDASHEVRGNGVAVTQDRDSTTDHFGVRLALALDALNMSRSQLAAALGVDKSVISRWVSGQMAPGGNNLARVSALFARQKPGFNVTHWTSSMADFENALGLAASRTSSGAAISADEIEAANSGSHTNARRLVPYAMLGAAIVLLVVIAAASFRQHGTEPPTVDRQRHPQIAEPRSMHSVAVMPFVNMSGDAAKDFFGDGVAEEILNDLSNNPNFRVAARTSSFSFKGKNADIGEIASKLHVNAVLEGSVRQEGGEIRIVAQLIDAKTGFHLWSARYDRKLDDLLAVQDEIARSIAAALSRKLVSKPSLPPIEPEAYREFLQAQYFFNQRTADGNHRADQILKGVLSRQPNFAAAYALSGHLLMVMTVENPALISLSRKMTAKALNLDPDNQEALDTKIELALRVWDWEAAYQAGHRLISQNVRSANSYNGIAFFYQYFGFPERALDARLRAAQLDPLNFAYRRNVELALWHLGRVGEAINQAQAALELQPNHVSVLHDFCAFHARAGRIAEARKYRQRIAGNMDSRSPAIGKVCDIEIALRAKDILQARELLSHANPKDLGAAVAGLLYARAGDLTAAMKLFSQAYDRHEQWLIWVRFDAATPRSLLRDPRWKGLWQRPLLVDWERYHNRLASELAARNFH